MTLMFRRGSAGVSLIELMIAILIGTLLLMGITSLFATTSNVNRMENGLARLQENGRFAMERITRDLRRSTSGRGMRKETLAAVGETYGDRGIISHVDFADRLQHGLPGNPGQPHSYIISPAFLMRGRECGPAACLPGGADQPGDDRYGGGLPDLGTAIGDRALGSDVLTMRYLRGVGVELQSGTTLQGFDGASIFLAEEIAIGPSGLIVLGDHQTTVIVSVTESGGNFSQLTLGGNISTDISTLEGLDGDIRVNDFDSDFLTVSYFLRLVEDPGQPDRRVSTLVRRVNGQVQEIAQGIERLDFLYHIEDINGDVSVLRADELSAPAVTDRCPKLSSSLAFAPETIAQDQPHCGWRMVRAVEVFLLANTIDNAGSSEEPFIYSFLSSGEANTDGTVEVACAVATCEADDAVTTLISGLPPERMLRREFRSISTLRNNAI